MTPKDNLMAVLSGGSPAWVPVCVHITDANNLPGSLPEELLAEPLDWLRITEFLGGDILYEVQGVHQRLPDGYDIQFETLANTRSGTLITPDRSLTEELLISRVESPRYDNLPQGHVMPGPIVNTVHKSFFVKDTEDYHVLADYHAAMRFEGDSDLIAQEVERVGEKGIVILGGGPSSPLYSLVAGFAGLERATYDLFDTSDAIVSAMRAMRESACRWYETAAQTPCEVIRCTEDLDTKLVSPDMFKEYAVPALREYAEICHSQGKLFVIHMCGPIREFLPYLTEIGVDSIHCLTTPDAFGNTSVREARRILSGRTAPMFRIPAEALLHGDTVVLDTFIDGLLEEIGDWRNVMVIIPCGRANPNVIRHVIKRMHERR